MGIHSVKIDATVRKWGTGAEACYIHHVFLWSHPVLLKKLSLLTKPDSIASSYGALIKHLFGTVLN